MVLFELEVSEDMLKECVGLYAQGAGVLYQRGQRGKIEGHNAGGGG